MLYKAWSRSYNGRASHNPLGARDLRICFDDGSKRGAPAARRHETSRPPEMPKLGQLLVQRGWASPEDVQRAIRGQGAAGRRLGTCLLECGALTEDLLLKALSEVHRVPAVGPEDLRGIPDETIAALPAKIAIRCKAVPFRSFATQVHVAMLDPRDLNCQDELAFALGKRVQPYVAPEVRIRQALDRYYGDECPSSIATLAERLDRTRYQWRSGAGPAAAAAGGAGKSAEGAGAPAGDDRRAVRRSKSPWEHPEAALFGGGTRPVPAPLPAPRAAGPAPAPPPAAARARPQASAPARAFSVALTEGERAELTEAPGPAEDETDDTRPIPADAPPLPLSFEEVEERLLRVTDPEEVGRLLVAFLGRMFERVALFRILRDRVEGWRGAGAALDEECLRSFRVGFDQPSFFLNLRQGGSFYLGPLPPMAVHKQLARCWGGSLPTECLLLPIRIRGRLVTAILADRGPGELGALDLESLVGLGVLAGEAYERCILRKKKD